MSKPKSIMTMRSNRGIEVTYYMTWKFKEIALNKFIDDQMSVLVFSLILENG